MSGRNLISLTRLDGHSFYLWFDNESFYEARKQLARWAADPQLPQFTYHTAELLSRTISQIQRETEDRDER